MALNTRSTSSDPVLTNISTGRTSTRMWSGDHTISVPTVNDTSVNYNNVAYGADNYDNNNYNHNNDSSGYQYEYYTYDESYNYGDEEDFHVYYRTFDFEKPIYLYVWETLVILTTIANILVMIILLRRNMRNSTNTILVSIAASDSLTGIVTLPAYMYAYNNLEHNDLKLTKAWCQAFMLSKFFLSKSFHMISICLTVLLGFQRFVSVKFPFKAHAMFTMPKTVIIIAATWLLTPLLHVYHLTETKVKGPFCYWEIEQPCRQSCVYLWATFAIMHFLPCIFLLVFTLLMVYTMHQSTIKMKSSNLISNRLDLKRRAAESRRISVIVIVVVVFFLIPEIPYAVFLVISLYLTHAQSGLLDLETNRAIHCAYELLLVCSFHANFWVYMVMNRKFRMGIKLLFDPAVGAIYGVFGMERKLQRRGSDASSYARTVNSALPTPMTPPNLEMRTYRAGSMDRDRTDRQLVYVRHISVEKK